PATSSDRKRLHGASGRGSRAKYRTDCGPGRTARRMMLRASRAEGASEELREADMKTPDPLSNLSLSSLCIHAGHRAAPSMPAVVAPIVQSTTFLLDDRSYAEMLAGRVESALIYTRL